MAHNYGKEKLEKAGKEGFAMVDHECLIGRKAAGIMSAIDCYEAAKKYGGMLFVDNPKRTKDNMSAMDCYEAAKIYGGKLVVEYPKRKPTRKAYY